jgi:hypothetical protein
MLPENLTSTFKRGPPIIHESPGALELLATGFLHSSNTGTKGQLCGCVLLGQLNLN